jgi:hypothetical protein
MKLNFKKIIPIILILIIVYMLYKFWETQEKPTGNGNGNGNGSGNGNGGATIICDTCINDVPSTFTHQGTICPDGSIPTGTAHPCSLSARIGGGGADDVTMEPIGVDPMNPNTPVISHTNEGMHPVLPMSAGSLSFGNCPNPLNHNSSYINILTQSPMTTIGVMQFLNLMRQGFQRGEDNPNSSGCNFLRKRQFKHHNDLQQSPASSTHISAPLHRQQKQAKLDFLSATIANCCPSNNTNNGCNNCDNLNEGIV